MRAMPRQARIDAPGARHHIIIRGIEGTAIFRNDNDRENFLERLSSLLLESHTPCYAWALMSNHAHLLLRTGGHAIASVMRRLLTGYAVSFNRRHGRSRAPFSEPLQIHSLRGRPLSPATGCRHAGIEEKQLAGPSKRPATARARALIGHIACVEFLIPGSEVARRLNIDRSAVSRATRRVGEDSELSEASVKIVEQIRRKDLKH